MLDKKRLLIIWPVVFIAIAFGILTIKSGGAVLFIDGMARAAAGNYVGFVVWFNFLVGFAYIIAGIGLWLNKYWATKLAIGIATATITVFAIFGLHIIMDGNYEMRTVVTMSLRSAIWIIIAVIVYFFIIKKSTRISSNISNSLKTGEANV